MRRAAAFGHEPQRRGLLSVGLGNVCLAVSCLSAGSPLPVSLLPACFSTRTLRPLEGGPARFSTSLLVEVGFYFLFFFLFFFLSFRFSSFLFSSFQNISLILLPACLALAMARPHNSPANTLLLVFCLPRDAKTGGRFRAFHVVCTSPNIRCLKPSIDLERTVCAPLTLLVYIIYRGKEDKKRQQ